ncbi:MAG: D-tyrosyl-tRNA(Tyr) deacylase [Bdellovibrionales bacterium]|nr:D-tyrosyl-tRNA(Tyr) deacylase [Bdellovibrionales bacterium]
MKAVIQRVSRAHVSVEGKVVGSIGEGIVTFLGVGAKDSLSDAEKIIAKILRLRIFPDETGKMNKSLLDIGGAHLIVSQFTLYADLSKGNRPSFVGAANLIDARHLYERALEFSAAQGVETRAGVFQADMQVDLTNAGPATFVLDLEGL